MATTASLREVGASVPAAGDASALASALLRVIERHTGRGGLAYAVPPAPLHGGFWAEIQTFRLTDPPAGFEGDLVLRLMPDEPSAEREMVVQAAVDELDFPVPHVRLTGGRDAGLGRPFIVMDRARGASLAGGLGAWQTIRVIRRLPALLAETMAALHALPVDRVAPRLAERGWSGAAVGVETRLAELEALVPALHAEGFEAGLAWLLRHRPEPGPVALCHGDLHGFNLIIAGGRVTAVVDWTNARLADPMLDVANSALILEQVPLAVPTLVRSVLNVLGRRARRRFLEAYRERRPTDADSLRWHEALYCLRLSARVTEARMRGSSRPALPASHPWEVSADMNRARFERLTGITLRR